MLKMNENEQPNNNNKPTNQNLYRLNQLFLSSLAAGITSSQKVP